MKTAEEILFKYTGWLGNAKMVHHDDALQAMEEFASQFKQSSPEGEGFSLSDMHEAYEAGRQEEYLAGNEAHVAVEFHDWLFRRSSPPKSEQPQPNPWPGFKLNSEPQEGEKNTL